MMKMFYVSLSDGYMYTHQNEHLKYVQFIVCKIYKRVENYQNLKYIERYNYYMFL